MFTDNIKKNQKRLWNFVGRERERERERVLVPTMYLPTISNMTDQK